MMIARRDAILATRLRGEARDVRLIETWSN
jgi:hypothetical protein